MSLSATEVGAAGGRTVIAKLACACVCWRMQDAGCRMCVPGDEPLAVPAYPPQSTSAGSMRRTHVMEHQAHISLPPLPLALRLAPSHILNHGRPVSKTHTWLACTALPCPAGWGVYAAEAVCCAPNVAFAEGCGPATDSPRPAAPKAPERQPIPVNTGVSGVVPQAATPKQPAAAAVPATATTTPAADVAAATPLPAPAEATPANATAAPAAAAAKPAPAAATAGAAGAQQQQPQPAVLTPQVVATPKVVAQGRR